MVFLVVLVNCILVIIAKKIKQRETDCKVEKIGRIVLGESLCDWRKFQLEDEILSIFLQGKEQNQRPIWQEVVKLGLSARIYWNQWDALLFCDGILFRKWESTSLKKHVFQVIVPREKIDGVLKEAHDSPYGGHSVLTKP